MDYHKNWLEINVILTKEFLGHCIEYSITFDVYTSNLTQKFGHRYHISNLYPTLSIKCINMVFYSESLNVM